VLVGADEQRLTKVFILENAEGDILDCGCGDGEILRFLYPLRPGKLIGIDISPERVNKALSSLDDEQAEDDRIDFEIVDIEDIIYDDGAFDTALMTDALQYLAHPETAMAEVARVLKKDGKLVATLTSLESKGRQNHGRFDIARLPESVGKFFTIQRIEERGGFIRLVAIKKPGKIRRVLELRPKRYGHLQVRKEPDRPA